VDLHFEQCFASRENVYDSPQSRDDGCFRAVFSGSDISGCPGSERSAAPTVYTGIVVTDVRVGTTLMHNVSLKITFEGDTGDIIQVVAPGSQTPIPSDECFRTRVLSLPCERPRSYGNRIPGANSYGET